MAAEQMNTLKQEQKERIALLQKDTLKMLGAAKSLFRDTKTLREQALRWFSLLEQIDMIHTSDPPHRTRTYPDGSLEPQWFFGAECEYMNAERLKSRREHILERLRYCMIALERQEAAKERAALRKKLAALEEDSSSEEED